MKFFCSFLWQWIISYFSFGLCIHRCTVHSTAWNLVSYKFPCVGKKLKDSHGRLVSQHGGSKEKQNKVVHAWYISVGDQLKEANARMCPRRSIIKLARERSRCSIVSCLTMTRPWCITSLMAPMHVNLTRDIWLASPLVRPHMHLSISSFYLHLLSRKRGRWMYNLTPRIQIVFRQ